MTRFKLRADKPRGFDYCDLVIATEAEGNEDWSQIVANERGRIAISGLISCRIDWEYGGTHSLSTRIGTAPDWRIIDVSLARYEKAGHAARVPRIEAEPHTFQTSLRWALGALLSGSAPCVVIYDETTGHSLVTVEDRKPVTCIICISWNSI